MRGKAKTGDCDRIEGRITPAYAGKSMIVKASKQLKPGSPPPMRGKGSFQDFP